MRILRQLIFALHFLIGVVTEVVLSLLLLLQSRGIIKSGKIVESEVQTIVVVQQVSPKRVYLANHARRCSLGQIFQQLQAFQPNKNSFGLKVLSPYGGRHCSHQIFPHFLLLLFFQQLHHLQRPRVNRLILHMRVVLIDRGVYL